MIKDISDFHEKFGLIMEPSQKPSLLDKELYDFRLGFLYEELTEFKLAHFQGDLPGAFDALIDLVYVAMGTAYLMGLPWHEGWDAVHQANMSKVRATEPSQSKRGTKYDVIKPEGFKPPDLQQVLDQYNARRMAQANQATTSE